MFELLELVNIHFSHFGFQLLCKFPFFQIKKNHVPLLKSCHSGDCFFKKLHIEVKYRGRPLGSYPFGKL
jgi:hypothetical protein